MRSSRKHVVCKTILWKHDLHPKVIYRLSFVYKKRCEVIWTLAELFTGFNLATWVNSKGHFTALLLRYVQGHITLQIINQAVLVTPTPCTCTLRVPLQLKSGDFRKGCWYPWQFENIVFIEVEAARNVGGEICIFQKFCRWKSLIWRFLGALHVHQIYMCTYTHVNTQHKEWKRQREICI